MMFSRLVNREQELRSLLRQLDRETVVLACQRLGYGTIFDALSPTLSYRLRMWRPDEYQVLPLPPLPHSRFPACLYMAECLWLRQ